ncbi:MAG TPA: bifunctional 4-hydroxy-2-oxoglutarate aldolase/2-dehydro-3-deoxy-phosphogluconate aldolase [Phycisphaerae bacterium]|jgi:2-dehydro-3-deoxyphosphogluconate aldolase/(4S)-4-hydroxy-2-oxoglutarate aldolase
MKKEIAFQKLSECGIVAVIRAQSDTQLMDITKALIEGGVIGIEVTMSTPKAIKGIEKVADALGDRCVVGVGTILDPGTAADAIHAGAEFVVSPVFLPPVIEVTRKLGKISVPGALSPTEILTAWSAGADVVKVYPASLVGPGYIKDLLAPMPFLRLSPSGGVDAKNVGEWLKAGAVMLGAGGSLVLKDAMTKGDWGAIASMARQFSDAVKAARAK